MELSNRVRDEIEKHIDLVDTDPFKFIDDCLDNMYVSADKEQFFEVVTKTLGLLTDFEDVIKKTQKELTSECYKIKQKYDVGGVTGVIACCLDPTINVTLMELTKSGRALEVSAQPDGSVPPNIPSEYNFRLESSYFNHIFIQLDKDNESSAKISLGTCSIHPTFKDLYTGEVVNKFIVPYDDFCNSIKQAIDTCINSFEWKKLVTEDLAPKLLNKLNDAAEKILGKQLYTIHTFINYVRINVPGEVAKQTKMELSAVLNFDEDPTNIDIDKLAATIEKNLVKLKALQDKRAAKEAEKKEYRKENNIVPVTRKDVSAAIRAAGFKPSSVCYTNKYANSTTYKYQFMDLSPDECKLVEDELKKIGADVVSVQTASSWGAHGAYDSLVVRVRN